MNDQDKKEDDAGIDGWTLTPQGQELAADLMGVIREATGMGEIAEGIRVKLRNREWLLVEADGGVEVWSFEDGRTVAVLDETFVGLWHDIQGGLVEASDAICESLAFTMMAVRGGEDHELTTEGRAMKEWLQVLPIKRSVKDGSCIDEFLSGDTETQTGT